MACPHLPRFHIALQDGWISDPNGPFFYKGLWHMFYQYIPQSSKWEFGLQWGHAVSKDMARWQHLPPAIVPTPGSADQDGVFSGCACIDEETGLPMLLYTGVRMRSSPSCGPLPPAPFDLNLPIIESQLIAWPADPNDPLLQVWCKGPVPLLALPPANMDLAGWRDPFITATPSTSSDGKYAMLLGGGLKNGGGLTLLYKSKHLTRGWEHEGFLCMGEPGPTGVMWECPLLARLQPEASKAAAALGMGKSLAAGAAPDGKATALRGVTAAPGLGASGEADLRSLLPTEDGSAQPLQARRCGQPDDEALLPAQQIAHGGTADGELLTAASLLSNCRCSSSAMGSEDNASTELSLEPACDPTSCYSTSAEAAPSPASIATCVLPPTPACTANAVLVEPPDSAGPHDPSLRHFFFCISPDVCTFPVLYWLGSCPLGDSFHIEGALGPFHLDLGDVAYAPNLVKDPQGRTLLVAWLQEKRVVGEYNYAGCMSAARVLTLDTSDPLRPYLVQRPLPELKLLRINSRQAGAGAPDLLPDHGSLGGKLLASHDASVRGKAAVLEADVLENAGEAVRRQGSKPLAGDGFAFSQPPLLRQQSSADGYLQAAAADGGSAACLVHDASQWDQGQPAASKGLEGQAVDALTASMARLGDPVMMLVGAGESVPITGVASACLDIEITFLPLDPKHGLLQRNAVADGDRQPERGAAGVSSDDGDQQQGLRSGLALRAWASSQGGSAAVLYDWSSGVLEVVFEAVDLETHQFSLAAPDVRRVGGRLQRPPQPGEPLVLRLLLDASLLEVFTGSGEVLSTRVYRGLPLGQGAAGGGAQPAMSGIDVISVGGTTSVTHLEAYEMSAIWGDISV